MSKCQGCDYRKYIARLVDIHIDEKDCPLEKCVMEESEGEK